MITAKRGIEELGKTMIFIIEFSQIPKLHTLMHLWYNKSEYLFPRI